MENDMSLPRCVGESFRRAGVKLLSYKTVTSTNILARSYDGELPVLIVAGGQTEGRGRLGRSFYSPEYEGLYMTLCIKAPTDSDILTRITALCAVAAAEGIESVCARSVDIKWVNDLYLGGKKVAGILAESFMRDGERRIAIGIGINLYNSHFPEDISDKAGALIGESEDTEEEKAALAYAIALAVTERLLRSIGAKSTDEYMARYRKRSCVIGREISFVREGRTLKARAVDINGDGGLEIVTDTGEGLTLSTGEISLRPVGEGW